MKAILYTAILLFSLTGLSQEVFLHEVDENLSMNIPEDSAEAEIDGQAFIQGTLGKVTMIILKTDKGHEQLAKRADLSKYYQGVRDGILKAGKGRLINESTTEIDNVQAANFHIAMEIEGEPKIVDSYVFFWKKHTYTIQFVSPEIESDDYKTNRALILESIDLQ